MSGTESHDGLLCKISNLNSLRGAKKLQGMEANAPRPLPPPPPQKKNPGMF